MSHARVLNARTVSWLPAAILATAGLLAAAGFGISGHSYGASTNVVSVGATVSKEVHMALNTGGSCGNMVALDPNERSITGASMVTTDNDVSFASCRLTFGTNNNAAGANLLVRGDRPAGAPNYSFCTAAIGSVCAAPQFEDVSTAGVTPGAFAIDDTGNTSRGKFGVSATNNSGCTGAMVASGNIYGLNQNGVSTNVCGTASTTDGDVTLTFRANPGTTQTASSAYLVKAAFSVTAN